MRWGHLAIWSIAVLVGVACGDSDAPAVDSGADGDAADGDAATACATVDVLASDAPDAWGVAIDDRFAYWTESRPDGRIARVPLTGGAVETIADGQAEPARLAVFEERVYWTNKGDGTVVVAPMDGSAPPTTLASGQMAPARIAVNATGVYWTDEDAGTVSRVGLDGTNIEVLADGLELPTGIALSVDAVFWTSSVAFPPDGYGGAVHRSALDGSGAVVLAESEAWLVPQDIAVGGGFAYWAHGGGEVMRLPIAGGEPEVVAERQQSPRGVAVDATYVAWTSSADRGFVTFASLDGSSPCVLDGERVPFGIASNGTERVWARNRTGEIVRAVFAE